MLRIVDLKIEGLNKACVTDKRPNISFALESDIQNEAMKQAVITVGKWKKVTTDQINNVYDGEMNPFTEYKVNVFVEGESGQKAEAETYFNTGRLDEPWKAKWITNMSYEYSAKESPVPMSFQHEFSRQDKKVKRAWINASALGIYELQLNGEKVGKDYFAPGFTSYDYQIQYQTYDITENLKKKNEILAIVGGGWAAGTFNYNRKSKISADRQALLCEIHIEYVDGEKEIIGSDSSWNVTCEGPYKFADWYDGEVYDATVDWKEINWKKADITNLRHNSRILAQYGCSVQRETELFPNYMYTTPTGELIYDFGQNFAGVINAKIIGKEGQDITFRHAEVLVDGELFIKSLRTAKATAKYICIEGEQQYSPKLTYMGFRYVGVKGIDKSQLELSAYVLHSNLDKNGEFECSNSLINQLQSNIQWGGKSNFVDIPTDCPQRDERLGWTGDIAVFARTACYNFDMSRFLGKWLMDMRSEQGKGGGLPMVIPRAGDAWPVMATACWGDSCILVPWAEYLARGDRRVLQEHYFAMKKFLKAAKWWSGFCSFTKTERYIWKRPFQWGDWCAPEGSAPDWIKHAEWVATAYFYNSCNIVSKIANILGEEDDECYYKKLSEKISYAYRKKFTDGKGTLKEEFQTAYVLPLYFRMLSSENDEIKNMTDNLVELIRKADNHLSTGFPGTPYILFALSDNGRADVAYELLLQETCPSWLYEVKAGGTTIWERWDALRPDGTVNITELSGNEKKEDESTGGMVSFNHYANGAVGDWLYRRCLGIETIEGGYKIFKVEPILGENLKWVKGKVNTPYGWIKIKWEIVNDYFTIYLHIPVSTKCNLVMPNKENYELNSGEYTYSCPI